MTTAADYEPELVDALNLLIEDERASVEMEVALASGATEYAERDALARMGCDDIRSCETLRAEMETAGLPVTPQINGVVFEVLGAERYDDRLRAFAHHQRIVADRASDLLESNLEGELRAALVDIVDAHQRHIEWANHRADEFAATRLMEFGPRQASQPAGSPTPPSITTDPSGVTLPVESSLPDLISQKVLEEALAVEPTAETPTAAPPAAAPPAADTLVEEAPVEAPEATISGEPAAGEVAPAEAAAPEAPSEQPAPRPRRGRPRKTAEAAE